MNYHLIDENVVMSNLENQVVIGAQNIHFGLLYHPRDLFFDLKNVRYHLDLDFLKIKDVLPIGEDAFVPTKHGFVKWGNPSIVIDSAGQELYGRLIDANYELHYSQFYYSNSSPFRWLVCSGYICLDSLPSNPIKMSKDNLYYVYVGSKPALVTKIPNSDIYFDEEHQKIILDFSRFKTYDIYSLRRMLGAKEGDIIYIFDFRKSVETGTVVQKLVITRGTCFATQVIVKYNNGVNPEVQETKELTYVCFD